MFGHSYYIIKKGDKCVIENAGLVFIRNKYEEENSLENDIKYFPEVKSKDLTKFDVDTVLEKIEKSDGILFSDLDSYKITGFNGENLDEFKDFIKNYVITNHKKKSLNIDNFYVKRLETLKTHFTNLEFNNVRLDDVFSPKYWCVTFVMPIKKVDSIKTLDSYSITLSEFKKLFKLLKDKPEKWILGKNKITFYYEIKDKVINYFSKIYRRKDFHDVTDQGYKFEDYTVLMNMLKLKKDGSMYVELHQLRGPGVNSAEDNSEIIEKFKKHMLEEYNCKFTFADNPYFFFNVL